MKKQILLSLLLQAVQILTLAAFFTQTARAENTTSNIQTTPPLTTIQGGVGDGGGGGYAEQDWNVRAIEMLAIIQSVPDHFGLTVEQIAKLKNAIDTTYVKTTDTPIKIIGPDGAETEKDAQFNTATVPTITFNKIWLEKDPIDQMSIQFHEYGGIIELEKNIYFTSVVLKQYLLENYRELHFAQLGKYRVQLAQGGSVITPEIPIEILNEITQGKYKSNLAAGNLPDPDVDSSKFNELESKSRLSIQVYCTYTVIQQHPEYTEPCNVLKSIDSQMRIANNPVIQGIQGPLKSIGFLVAKPECEYWGSAAVHRNTPFWKTFFKTIAHVFIYPILQVKDTVEAVIDFYENKQLGPNHAEPQLSEKILARTLEVIAVPTGAIVSAGVAIMYSPAGTMLAITDTIAKGFGKNDLIERSSACREPGWF